MDIKIKIRLTKTKKGVVKKESDHNVIETRLKLKWNNKHRPEPREEIFNLKNSECQKKFKQETSNTNKLSKIIEEEQDLEVATEKFLKKLNKVIYKCFKKIGIRKEKQKSSKKIEDLQKFQIQTTVNSKF